MTLRCGLPVIAAGSGHVLSGMWSSAKIALPTQSPAVSKFAVTEMQSKDALSLRSERNPVLKGEAR